MNLSEFERNLPLLYNNWHTSQPTLKDGKLSNVGQAWAMSVLNVGGLLNCAVSYLEADEVHLEIGVLQGATLTWALVGNDARAWAVDDWSMFHTEVGNRAIVQRRLKELGMDGRVTLYDQDYEQFLLNPPDGRVGTYFYDGPHSYDDTYRALELAIPLFSDRTLIVVDDFNWDDAPTDAMVASAVSDWLQAHEDNARMMFDLRTALDEKTWWNGIAVIGWRR